MFAGRVALLELKHQLRGPVLRIVASISFFMIVASALIDALKVGPMSSFGTGAELVIRVHLVWTLFYLFTSAAFVGEAVTRDEQSGFAPIVRATQASESAYLLGRFAGATTAVLLCFLTVPIGVLVVRLLPNFDPAWAGAFAPSAFGTALLVLAIPNLLLGASLFLVLATATRSISGCLVGAVILLSLYGFGAEGSPVSALVEPFGFAAVRLWQAGDLEPLLANRVLWLALALLFIVASVWLEGHPISVKRRRSAKSLSPSEPIPATSAVLQAVRPRHDLGTAFLQYGMRVLHHVRETTRAPTFMILLLLGLASCVSSLWSQVGTGASLQSLIMDLIQSFVLVPVVVVLFFAGEIRWSDRSHRIDPIIETAPAPRFVLLLAEITALGTVLLLLALASGAALPLLLAIGGRSMEISTVLGSYVLPKSYDWLLLGILAWFLQTISRSKFEGWGYFVLFLIMSLGLDQAGFNNPLFHYGRYPGAPVPPDLTGEDMAQRFRIFWGAVALLLLAVALSGRLRRAPA